MEVNTRNDRFTFYVMAIMSFLESTAPTFVDNLKIIYKNDKKLLQWLDEAWLPEEFEHGKLGREFVLQTWPEFDWDSAYKEFLIAYEPRCSHEVLRSSLAMEALCRCVTETEATMFYRCIGNYTASDTLKKLMRKLSTDETRHYREFRDVFERYDAIEKNSTFTKVKTILSRAELTKDEDIKMAFAPLNSYWHKDAPFEKYTFSDFLGDAKAVIINHFPVDAAKKMLFKPVYKKGLANKILLILMEILVKSHYLGLAAQLSFKHFTNPVDRPMSVS